MKTRQRALLMAYQSGIASFKAGLPMEACPYPRCAEYRRAWEMGFADERKKRERLSRKIRRELALGIGDRK
jgi:ribosome modulation factor